MNKIPRKPIAHTASKSPLESYDLLDDLIDDYIEPPPALIKTYHAVQVDELPQVISTPLDQDLRSPVVQRQKSTPVLAPSPSEISVASCSSAPEALVPSRSRWKTVVDETVYFAGGLISHPFESTKHNSILRHSSALVYYKGPSTNVIISVFGDTPLPSDRSFWLQRKGFSGNIGMAASALMRTTSNWIDVTPSVETLASSVPEGDERAWQRDIKKFLKRASKDKRLSKHIIRETCVLRVPADAADGYLRIVMCTGQSSKKSLCPSPTFRLASTSSDISVLRGASLTTLPLEVGLKAASVVGNQYIQRFVGPAQAVVQSKFKQLQPAFITNNSEKLALARTGIEERFSNLDGDFDAERDVTYNPFHEEGTLDEPPKIIGSDSGPERPFPITFDGKVVPGTGQGLIPTANLSNVAEELLLRLNGIYIGWASIESRKFTNGIPQGWHEAIIIVGPSPYAAPRVVARKMATVHIIYEFEKSTTFFDTKLKVMIMSFLGPLKPNHSSLSAEIATTVSHSKEIAVASLSRERWRHEAGLQILSSEKAQRTTADKYVGLRSQVQRHVDSIPVHWAGVRTARAELKDEAYGRGGFYIRR
ncbi:hypothetical protein HD806DRAFT_476017 [Xylariaceae sp. AK1471]|nr:hypothetical protein HD806DRAFT_476017 [Xylariaceae sp. AK1471]